MTTEKMITKSVQFPPDLVKEAKEASLELNMNFSELVRTATCLFIRQGCQDKFKQLLAEGYQEKAKLNRCICDDFKDFDGENLS